MQNIAKHCLIKFVISFVAGCCAVFVPRLAAVLAASNVNNIEMLPSTFVILGFVFASLIGLVVVILEFNKICHPADTFMTALGIPTLLAGALATTASTNNINELSKLNSELADAARNGAQIRKVDTALSNIRPITLNDRSLNQNNWVSDALFIQSALAQDTETTEISGTAETIKEPSWSTWATIKVQEPQYAIVLDTAPSADEAIERVSQLKDSVPSAQAIETSEGFFVIGGIKPKSSAVLEAIKIKEKTGINPELILTQ